MIVHIITSKTQLPASISVLRRIVKAVHEKEASIARDWIEPAFIRYSRRSVDDNQDINWPALYKDNLEAIAKADVIVAEITNPSFGVGYQVAIASQQKKPTLVLRRDDASKDSFASGVADGCVEYKEYNDDNLEKTVRDFLDEHDIQSKDMRFNFFIDRQIYNYLRWAAFKTGKTKAEILRELVQREIEVRKDF